MFENFLNDEDGATAVEYGLITVTLVSIMFGFFWWYGDVMTWGFTTMADCIAVSFDTECYSASSNRGVPSRSGDPMWWPST
jgi:Flp pilus assembly pilin Flp